MTNGWFMRGTDPIKSRWECLRIMMFVAMCSRIFDRLLQLIFVYLGPCLVLPAGLLKDNFCL